MLYLGIDQHKSHITVNLRPEDGSVILMRQVSTRWEKIRAFFEDEHIFRWEDQTMVKLRNRMKPEIAEAFEAAWIA